MIRENGCDQSETVSMLGRVETGIKGGQDTAGAEGGWAMCSNTLVTSVLETLFNIFFSLFLF